MFPKQKVLIRINRIIESSLFSFHLGGREGSRGGEGRGLLFSSEFLCFEVATLDLLADHGHCGGEVPQEEDEEAEAAH